MKHLTMILTALVGSIALTTAVVADEAADVKAAMQGVLAAYNDGDADAIAKYFLKGADHFDGDGRLLGPFDKAQLKAAFEAGVKYDFEWRDLEVKVYGNSAVGTALMVGTITSPDGTTTQGPWRNSGTWVKQKGSWKVAHYHVSEVLPDIQGVQQLISRYHQAYTDKDLEEAMSCIGAGYVRAIRPLDSSRVTGWFGGFGTHDEIRQSNAEWVGAPNFSYTNAIEFLHTNIDEKSGVVVTRETGAQTSGENSGEWKDLPTSGGLPRSMGNGRSWVHCTTLATDQRRWRIGVSIPAGAIWRGFFIDGGRRFNFVL